jgi:hypothetical protein
MRGLKGMGVVLALTVAVLSGCGGDDDNAGAGADPAATGGNSAAPTEPSEDSPTGVEAFCADIEAAGEALRDVTEDPEITDPQAALDTVQESLDVLRTVDPPDQIAADWATVESYLDAVATGLEGLDANDPAELVEQLEDLGNQLDDESAELEAAGARIEAYVNDECGVVLE